MRTAFRGVDPKVLDSVFMLAVLLPDIFNLRFGNGVSISRQH